MSVNSSALNNLYILLRSTNFYELQITKLIRHCAFLLSSVFCLLSSSSFSQVTANFSATPIAGCAPLFVQFTDLSTGGITSWNWNLGNGVQSANQTPSTIYLNTGVYTVTLTVSNGTSSNTIIKTNYINVYKAPTAGFILSNDTACIGQVITFSDSTIISAGGSPIGNWGWNFGDGNSASTTNDSITHAYTSAGNYPVSMIVTDANGCSGNITQNILVVPKPTVSFSATPTFACVPSLNVTFTNTSSTIGTTTYFWNFGDGNTSSLANPTNNYTSAGMFTVTLIVNQNGCIDSIVMPNYIVIQNITAAFTATPSSVCTGDTITFTNTSIPTAVSANWNFGDAGTSTLISPTHIYSTAGNFIVTMTATDISGCTNTTTATVTVNQTPTANFIADTMSSCSVPFTVTFTNQSTGGTNYSWNFGDGGNSTLTNPVYTYTTAGTYTVTLIAINSAGGCSDTIVKNTFIIISFPQANFTHLPDSGCVPLTVNFSNTSISTVDPITTYTWTFGDGSPNSALQNPVHTYTATGIYSVTLIVQTANGCIDTFTCVNCTKVGTPPIANFGIVQDTVCYGLPVQFNDLSSSIPVTGWYWDFGDGGNSTMQNPQYTYGDTGTYMVYLIAYNNGCADTSLIQNVVILPPKAVFTYTLSCTNYYTVVFQDASAGADSIFWNFGDGSMGSSNNNPVHIYPSRGPFTVTLTAYNFSTGCSNSVTETFTIAEPIASFSVTNTTGCYPFTANFFSTSQDANFLFWNFGDTAVLSDTATVDTTYTYNYTSQYNVSLIITDVNGCKDTATFVMGALGPYPYFFANTTGCRPFVVTFKDTSFSDSLLVQWTWDFGDGSPVIVTNNDSIIHTYFNPGLYSVTMTVKDTNGCVNTITTSDYIQPTFPYPSFTVNTFSCKGTLLTFNASATTVVGGTYLWNFGDGTGDTTTATSTTHAYASDSTYIVTLTVTDINGCDSTISDTILILQPTANFSWAIDTMYCNNMQVSFTDSSVGYVTSWFWDFDTAGASTLQNPTAFYSTGGVYSATLIVTNAGGCIDTMKLDSIISVPFAVGTFTLAPADGCNPLTACFSTNAQNTTGYFWDFGDGSTGNSAGDTCHTYLTPGIFNPQLLLQYTLPAGAPCSQIATNQTGPVIVTNVISVSLSQPSVITVPVDSIISVTANYSGGMPPYTFSWTPNTGISCGTCSSVFIIGTGDSILYTFTIYDAAGCIGITSILILSEPCFEPKIIPNVFTPNNDDFNDVFYIPGVCSYEDYSLQIFDRWGTLMFTTAQRNNGWDGRNNSGMQAKDGVYYFVVHLNGQRDIAGNKMDDQIFKGFVTLMR